jgi:general secretion pathway protein G
LIEILIVILVVAILAMIVVPRALGAGRQARDCSLRADLHEVRAAVEAFRADMGGHPSKLAHLMRDKSPDECRLPPNGEEIDCIKRDYRGPYLMTPDKGLPVDPVTGARDWVYDEDTGFVRSAAQGVSARGAEYSSW